MLNNAGMLVRDDLSNLTTENFVNSFIINSIGPIKVAEAFLGHLKKGHRKLIANVTSVMGSIHENGSGGYYSYRASKTALNMIMKSAALDLASQDIKVLLLHPGWVKTRMGTDTAPLMPPESIAGMRKVIESYSPERGEVIFYRFNGEKILW